jgi:ribosomal protein L7Ae-like RNA K-turn-binding protein
MKYKATKSHQMPNESKIFSLFSLCKKAGKMAAGETAAEKLLRNGAAQLIIIAQDASVNTQKKFINKCFYYKKPKTCRKAKPNRFCSDGCEFCRKVAIIDGGG